MTKELGMFDIDLDFENPKDRNTTTIYYKVGDINTSSARLKCSLGNQAIDLTGYTIAVRVETTLGEVITEYGEITDAKNGIIEIRFSSKSIEEGTNYFEVLLTKGNKTKKSPRLMYKVLDSIFDNNSMANDTNYPILISLIRDVNSAINKANEALNKSNDSYSKLDAKLKEATKVVQDTNTAKDGAIKATEDVNKAIAAGTQDLEVKEARDGEVSLKLRLQRDLYKNGISVNTRIDNLEHLKEFQNIAYETESNYINCLNTVNGMVEKFKIRGKTLVNLCDIKTHTTTKNQHDLNPSLLKPLTTYTVTCDISVIGDALSGVIMRISYKDGTFSSLADGTLSNFKGKFNQTIVTHDKEIDSAYIGWIRNPSGSYSLTMDNITILEGDHTQNQPSYFEKLYSVSGSQIEVISRKEDGNLFDGEILIGKYDPQGAFIEQANVFSTSKFNIPGNREITINCLNPSTMWVNYWDPAGNHIRQTSITTSAKSITTPSNTHTCAISSSVNYTLDNLQVEYGSVRTEYKICKAHKKPIMYKNDLGELIPLTTLREWDCIEKIKDKYRLTICSGKVVLTGDENWVLYSGQSTSNVMCVYSKAFDGLVKNTNQKSDKFPTGFSYWDYDGEVIGVDSITGTNRFFIKILKSKADTIDKLKVWLKANPVTVVYQLAEPKIYEVNNLDLESYEGETAIITSSGAISPPIEFELTTHLGNYTKVVNDRLKALEEEVFNYNTIQNRLQLKSIYSADRVTFRVDTSAYSTVRAKQDLDYDIFELLKNVIIVGTDNYDRLEIEEIMDFYVSIGKLDYDMWDELWIIMEIQHNPPVETPEI